MNIKNQISMIDGYSYEPPTPTEVANANKRHKKPQEMYGLKNNGETCRTCKHVYGFRQSKQYYKCEKWILSHSEATDIRLKWPACGKWEKDN